MSSISPTTSDTAVIFGGTIAIDHVKTPEKEASSLLGGSASYAALAASFWSEKTSLVGVIGNNFPQEHLDLFTSKSIDLTGIQREDKASFAWSGEYHENMNDRTTHSVTLDILENWSVQVPEDLKPTPVLVLANMSPQNQLEMLAQSTAEKSYIIADTMDLWIQIDQENLLEVIQKINLFILNDSEAKMFAQTNNTIEAGEWLLNKGLNAVIIKHGEYGATLFFKSHSEQTDYKILRIPAYPLAKVVDPTGAGDCFLGALAGTLASQSQLNPKLEDLFESMVNATVVASFVCEDFSVERLKTINFQDIQARRSDFLATIHPKFSV